jgi:hypothetical protein
LATGEGSKVLPSLDCTNHPLESSILTLAWAPPSRLLFLRMPSSSCAVPTLFLSCPVSLLGETPGRGMDLRRWIRILCRAIWTVRCRRVKAAWSARQTVRTSAIATRVVARPGHVRHKRIDCCWQCQGDRAILIVVVKSTLHSHVRVTPLPAGLNSGAAHRPHSRVGRGQLRRTE